MPNGIKSCAETFCTVHGEDCVIGVIIFQGTGGPVVLQSHGQFKVSGKDWAEQPSEPQLQLEGNAGMDPSVVQTTHLQG